MEKMEIEKWPLPRARMTWTKRFANAKAWRATMIDAGRQSASDLCSLATVNRIMPPRP